MDQGLAAVLGASVGVLGSTLAVALGGRQQERSQREHWRRQSRRDAYAAFADHGMRISNLADDVEELIKSPKATPSEIATKLADLRTHVDELARLSALVVLEGPPEVSDLADLVTQDFAEICNCFTEWLDCRRSRSSINACEAKYINAHGRASDHSDEFMNKAREFLK